MGAMQEVVIYGVSFDMVGKQPIVLLKTVEGNRFLPIWIGHAEASAILMKLQGTESPRPMTHDLFKTVLDDQGVRLERVEITELRDGTFYAELTLVRGGERSRDRASCRRGPRRGRRRPGTRAPSGASWRNRRSPGRSSRNPRRHRPRQRDQKRWAWHRYRIGRGSFS